MNNSDNFDRKSNRKEKYNGKTKKRHKDYLSESYEEHRFAKLNRQQIKRKIEEEDTWENWDST